MSVISDTFSARRRLASLVLAAACLLSGAAWAQSPATGAADPAFAELDDAITTWMAKYQIPGAAVAVSKDGRMVYSRGFGFADRDTQTPVQPDSLFRVASLSKPVTGAAIMKLVEQGRVNLDAKAWDLLAPDLRGVTPTDARLREVTLRQLMQHTWGLDRTKSADTPGAVLTSGGQVVNRCAQYLPSDLAARRLDFAPGTRYAYNNLGLCMAGRVIELVTGQPYERAVKQLVLNPLGIHRARLSGSTPDAADAREVKYYDRPDAPQVEPLPYVYANNIAPARVSRPYGGFEVAGYQGAGQWVFSAPDYLRFVNGLRGFRQPEVLSAATRNIMFARPPAPLPRADEQWYGVGVSVQESGIAGAPFVFHDGWVHGTRAFFATDATRNLAWVVMFNAAPNTNYNEDASDTSREINDSIWNSLRLAEWPSHDLFASTSSVIEPESGWWWRGAAYSGTGFAIEKRGDNLFMAGYLYDASGRATWVVAGGPMSSSSTFEGELVTFKNGQTLAGAYRQPEPVAQSMGRIAINFVSPTRAQVTWPGGTTNIERFEFMPQGTSTAPAPFQPETGWWWNPRESGRGFALEVQRDTVFLAGYLYDDEGEPIWLVASGKLNGNRNFNGTWQQFANGQTIDGPYRAPTRVASNIGALSIQFQSTTSATLRLPNGREIPITRFAF